MQIVITDWALQSYLNLKHKHVFTNVEYWTTLRPDVELLKQYPYHSKFGLTGFWGPVNQGHGVNTQNGYKVNYPPLKRQACEEKVRACLTLTRPSKAGFNPVELR